MLTAAPPGGNEAGSHKLWHTKDESAGRPPWPVLCAWVECCPECILVAGDGDEAVPELGD